MRCRSSQLAEDFDVVVDASLVEGSRGAADDAVLAAVFRTHVEEDSGEVGGTVSSALCLYRMSDVRRRFTDNIRRCFAGQQTFAGLQFGNRMCVSLVSIGRIPRHRHRHPREDRREDVGVSGDFPVQLATGITSGNRKSDVSARIIARMSVSV